MSVGFKNELPLVVTQNVSVWQVTSRTSEKQESVMAVTRDMEIALSDSMNIEV